MIRVILTQQESTLTKILLGCGNDNLRMLVLDELKKIACGIQIMSTADGVAFHESALMGGYDVLIADRELPNFPGLCTLGILRGMASTTRFILLSSDCSTRAQARDFTNAASLDPTDQAFTEMLRSAITL
ncbi:hypothetical protein C4568_05070 [Candidatus Parcubacteria bacterium]|nr:MAG: hypothetical protein C4568_05070 [Candidatus Parcubacteria bacterium]